MLPAAFPIENNVSSGLVIGLVLSDGTLKQSVCAVMCCALPNYDTLDSSTGQQTVLHSRRRKTVLLRTAEKLGLSLFLFHRQPHTQNTEHTQSVRGFNIFQFARHRNSLTQLQTCFKRNATPPNRQSHTHTYTHGLARDSSFTLPPAHHAGPTKTVFSFVVSLKPQTAVLYLCATAQHTHTHITPTVC